MRVITGMYHCSGGNRRSRDEDEPIEQSAKKQEVRERIVTKNKIQETYTVSEMFMYYWADIELNA